MNIRTKLEKIKEKPRVIPVDRKLGSNDKHNPINLLMSVAIETAVKDLIKLVFFILAILVLSSKKTAPIRINPIEYTKSSGMKLEKELFEKNIPLVKRGITIFIPKAIRPTYKRFRPKNFSCIVGRGGCSVSGNGMMSMIIFYYC